MRRWREIVLVSPLLPHPPKRGRRLFPTNIGDLSDISEVSLRYCKVKLLL